MLIAIYCDLYQRVLKGADLTDLLLQLSPFFDHTQVRGSSSDVAGDQVCTHWRFPSMSSSVAVCFASSDNSSFR